MLDRAASHLLGSVEDRRAYPPPKAVHRANAEATIRRPCASIHDGSSSAQNARAGRALTGPTDLVCVLQLIELLLLLRHCTLDSRPVSPLSIKSTYFEKTS